MGLPSALGVVPVGAGHREDEVPQAVDGLDVRRAGEDLTRPCGHGDAGDAPDVAAKVHSIAEGLALVVARLGGRGRLGRVYALERGRVGALQEEEGGARLGKGVELLDLPGGRVAEPVDIHVLVGQAADGVVVPDDSDVAGAGAVAGRHHAAGKVGALDGALDDKLLAGPDGGALLHQQVGIEVKLVGERLGGNAALLVGHGNGRHGDSSRSARVGRVFARPGGKPAHGVAAHEKGPFRGPEHLWSGQRDSNPRMSAWEADALPLGDARMGLDSTTAIGAAARSPSRRVSCVGIEEIRRGPFFAASCIPPRPHPSANDMVSRMLKTLKASRKRAERLLSARCPLAASVTS